MEDLKSETISLCLVVRGEEQPLQPTPEEVQGLLVELDDVMAEPQ